MGIFRKSLIVAAMTAGFSQMAYAQDLLELLDIAYKEDRAYQAAVASNKSVKVGEEIADAGYYPTIAFDASANAVDLDRDSGVNDGSSSNEKMAVSLVQPLYNRNLGIASDSAVLSSGKSDADLLLAKQDLVVRLASAYFEVLAALDTRTFVEADKKAIARQLDQAQQRFDVGLIAITSVHEAQAAYDQSIANEIAVNNRVDNAYEALREIVGELELSLDILSDKAKFDSPDPSSLQEWSTLALQQNPGVLSAKQASELSLKNIELQRNGHYPTLNLVGSQTYYNDSNTASSGDYDQSLVGLSFNLPLYEGGGVDASVKQAQLDFETAQYNLEKTQRSVTRQVKDAYRGVVASISKIKALEAVRVSAKSALDATEAGYEVGTRTIVDVLNAQRNLFEALNNYADARYQYMVNLLSLKQAAGTLSQADVEYVNQWLVKK